jgi:carbamoylphosphate synthase large subunit
VLGTPVEAIIATEDRDIFSRKLAEINESLNPNIICVTIEEAIVVSVQAGLRVTKAMEAMLMTWYTVMCA